MSKRPTTFDIISKVKPTNLGEYCTIQVVAIKETLNKIEYSIRVVEKGVAYTEKDKANGQS